MTTAQVDQPAAATAHKFVAIDRQVMSGPHCVAVASSHTMAKRIARALNLHRPNQKGY